MTIPRILSSSKYQAAWVVTALASVTLYFTLSDKAAGRPERQAAISHYILVVAGAWGVSTAGTAWEDYAAKRDAPTTATPAVQVNTGSDAANVQQGGPPPGTFVPIITPGPPPIIDPAARTSSPAPPPKQP